MTPSIAVRSWRVVLHAFGVLALGVSDSLIAQRASTNTNGSAANRLVGAVYDTLGTPVAGASVRLRRSPLRTVSGPNGRYALIGPKSGPATLIVERDGFPMLTIDTQLAGADTIDVILAGAVAPTRTTVDSLIAAGDPPRPVAAPPPRRVAPVAAPAAGMQAPPRAIVGVVTDTTGAPLVGAIVDVVTQQRIAITDSSGRFALRGLAVGPALVRIRRIGFAQGSFTTTVSADDGIVAEISMGSLGQVLSRVTVRENALSGPRLAAFVARRRAGFGQFLTRDQFVDRNPLQFTDLMNRFIGVSAGFDGRGKKRIYGRGRCEMGVFLNGMRMRVPDGSSVDDFFDVYDIEAVEVYRGVGTVPPEFSGEGSSCGVVAAWTRVRNGR
jgi:hypothetical protein